MLCLSKKDKSKKTAPTHIRTLCHVSLYGSLLTLAKLVTPFVKTLGGASISLNLASNVYRIEMVGGKWRAIAEVLAAGLPAQTGHMLLGLAVWAIPDMRTLEFILGGMGLISLPLWYLMPESPQWLLAKGRIEKTRTVILRISEINRRKNQCAKGELTEFLSKPKTTTKEASSPGFFDLFRYPNIRRNFCLLCFIWFSFSLGYYGLIYNTPPLSWNLYLVFIFPTFFTIPVLFVEPYLENKFGRKKLLTFWVVIHRLLLAAYKVNFY